MNPLSFQSLQPQELVSSLAEVFAVPVHQDSALEKHAENVLAREEIDILRRHGNSPDRGRFLCGRLALRLLLSERLKCLPRELHIFREAGGRPRLRPASWRFNLSHSGSWVAIALHPTRDLGVDIEAPRVLRRPEKLLRRLKLTPKEESIDLNNQFALRSWTRAEACLKASGWGISQLQRVTPPQPGNDRWHIQSLSFTPDKDYHGAVAVVRDPHPETHRFHD